MRIDVTVAGSIFSGDGLFYAHSTLPRSLAEDNYMDYIVEPTFATYTVVHEVLYEPTKCCFREGSYGTEVCR